MCLHPHQHCSSVFIGQNRSSPASHQGRARLLPPSTPALTNGWDSTHEPIYCWNQRELTFLFGHVNHECAWLGSSWFLEPGRKAQLAHNWQLVFLTDTHQDPQLTLNRRTCLTATARSWSMLSANHVKMALFNRPLLDYWLERARVDRPFKTFWKHP